MIIGEYSPRRSRGEYSPIITEPEPPQQVEPVTANHIMSLRDNSDSQTFLRALSFRQNWPDRPVSLQRKCNSLKEPLAFVWRSIYHPRSTLIWRRSRVSPSKCPVTPVSSVKWKVPLNNEAINLAVFLPSWRSNTRAQLDWVSDGKKKIPKATKQRRAVLWLPIGKANTLSTFYLNFAEFHLNKSLMKKRWGSIA